MLTTGLKASPNSSSLCAAGHALSTSVTSVARTRSHPDARREAILSRKCGTILKIIHVQHSRRLWAYVSQEMSPCAKRQAVHIVSLSGRVVRTRVKVQAVSALLSGAHNAVL